MVLDVAHLVARHAFELLAVHDVEQPRRERDGCFLGAQTSGKGVGGGVVDHVDVGLGDPLADGEGLHQVVKLLVLGRVGRQRARDPQDEPGSRVQRVENPGDSQESADRDADDHRAEP